MASFRRALHDGAEGFEFDVRATRDGTAVLLHDETLDRTTTGHGRLADLTRAQIDDLDAGTRFSESYQGERIPTLADVLDRFLGRFVLAMELKEPMPEPVLLDVAARLRANRDADLVAASFREDALAGVRDLIPAVPRALVLRQGQALPPQATRTPLGLWGLFARQEDVDERFVMECRREGLGLYAYPVNDPARAAALAALGIEGIISDDPSAVRAAL